MFRSILGAVVLSVLALGAWQANGATPAAQAVPNGCEGFSSQAHAQSYYNSHPDAQSELDPDNDGIACEGFDFSKTYPPYYDYSNCKYGLYSEACYCPGLSYGAPYYGNPYNNPYYYGACNPHTPPQFPAYVPAPGRPSLITLQIANTRLNCNEETAVVARLVYPNGAGASAHMVTFQSSLGTVFTNILTDANGYATTKFVAPASPGSVQITAFGDGLTNMQTVTVTCGQPAFPVPPAAPPAFAPPRTGEAGLATQSSGSMMLWLGLAAGIFGAPAAVYAVAKVRR